MISTLCSLTISKSEAILGFFSIILGFEYFSNASNWLCVWLISAKYELLPLSVTSSKAKVLVQFEGFLASTKLFFGLNLFTYLDWTPIFEWYMVRV
jgi:hypothetical protein